jgi:hypothetical protein
MSEILGKYNPNIYQISHRFVLICFQFMEIETLKTL